jgi:translation initiation factor 1
MKSQSFSSLGQLSGLVYSTEAGRMCPACRHSLAQCVCKQRAAAALPVGSGAVRVARQTKGRGGKAVTVVTGLPHGLAELNALGKELKAACGSGGTVKGGVVEVQGDHVEKLLALLLATGYAAKRSGG